jgi:raffinose/stachyose/melibiose transport system substrate-binding protein
MKKSHILTLLLAASVAGAVSAQTELKMSLYKQEIAPTINLLTDAFTKANPGIKITTEIHPNDGGATQAAAAAAGKLPDIIQTPAYSEVYSQAKNGYLVDLTGEPVIKKVNVDLLDGVLYQNKVFALPTDVGTIGILYNKQIFAKLGLKVPTTYLELQQVAATLKKNNIIPFAGLLKENWSIGQFISLLHGEMIAASGEPNAVSKFAVTMGVGVGDWGKAVDLKKLFGIMDWYKANLSPDAVNNSWNEEVAEFATGKAAMVVQGQWFINPVIDAQKTAKTDFVIGFTPFTWSNKAADNKFFASADSTFALSAQSTKEKQAAAKKFLEWMASPEAVQIWTANYKLVPTFKGASLKALPPAFGDITASIAAKGSVPWEYALAPSATFEGAIKGGALDYMLGKITPEAMADAVTTSWKANFKP